MTDAEKLSALATAATYQQQYDALIRTRDGYKAQLATTEQLLTAKKKMLDDHWAFIKREVGSNP